MKALGFYKEDASKRITLKLTKDKGQLLLWEQLRQKYPRIISSCVTNDWVLQSIRAQRKFSRQYELMRTPCLIFKADEDVFVYNHAIDLFATQAPFVRYIYINIC